MLLLLTNDDGINADGLRALVERALEIDGLEILVVAPDRERSASGHAISIHQPIEVREIDTGERRLRMFAASGTPADCVKLAVDGILEGRPDLLISGVNRGPNLGTDVFYSGTVSAALEGALLGVKSVAVSVGAFENIDYGLAAEFALRLGLEMTRGDGWPNLVNVNVPAVPRELVAGVAITRLGIQSYRDTFKKRFDPKGRCWFWLGGVTVDRDEPDDTDTCAIRRNLISVTPLKVDLTDYTGIEALSARDLPVPWRLT
ncbi:MAG TPA: 5'/3'-nucleotidase SurE [Firmicutes bacterium]|uniref:5'-nucleotidase SurE n=1 Tax=Candidatus Fermentithermobacillus carboniphilus TaxID=3085328 RepID=A0AAT9LE30_9FIRM|nr:MAG: 5'/3'-nucleotidase SurE [Candidatus Fermentithermobacillus carboniphilus]HHW17559.1 5'/3'-nucleotidase SurE [Candidatus Fermentithermobacillaceae bacterium]